MNQHNNLVKKEKGITVKRVIKDMVSKRSQIDVNQPMDQNQQRIQIDPNMRHLVNEISDTVGHQLRGHHHQPEVNLFD